MMGTLPAGTGAVQGAALMLPEAHARATRSDAYLASVAECLREPAVASESASLLASWDAGAARLLDCMKAEELREGLRRPRGFAGDQRTGGPKPRSPRVPSSSSASLAATGTDGRAVAATVGTLRHAGRKDART